MLSIFGVSLVLYFINNLDCSSIFMGFCSLDVCNLYGSIPVHNLNENKLSVYLRTKDKLNHAGKHYLENLS